MRRPPNNSLIKGFVQWPCLCGCIGFRGFARVNRSGQNHQGVGKRLNTGVIGSDMPWLARLSGLQCFNMGHNSHGINMHGVIMTLMGN